jgi:elongation factor Ts
MPIITAGICEPDENRNPVVPRSKGCVASFTDEGRKVGAIMELQCESDFVAGCEEFQRLAEDIAAHVADANPRYLRKEDVPRELAAEMRELYGTQAIETGKSGSQLEEFVKRKQADFWTNACLLEQRFARQPEITISQLIARVSRELEAGISVRRFARFNMNDKQATFAVSKRSTNRE